MQEVRLAVLTNATSPGRRTYFSVAISSIRRRTSK